MSSCTEGQLMKWIEGQLTKWRAGHAIQYTAIQYPPGERSKIQYLIVKDPVERIKGSGVQHQWEIPQFNLRREDGNEKIRWYLSGGTCPVAPVRWHLSGGTCDVIRSRSHDLHYIRALCPGKGQTGSRDQRSNI